MPIEFSPNSRADSRRAFLEHLARFERQGREVSWTDAPFEFSASYGRHANGTTLAALRGGMEAAFDAGEIKIKRLPNGGNRLVAVPKAKASRRTKIGKPIARADSDEAARV